MVSVSLRFPIQHLIRDGVNTPPPRIIAIAIFPLKETSDMSICPHSFEESKRGFDVPIGVGILSAIKMPGPYLDMPGSQGFGKRV